MTHRIDIVVGAALFLSTVAGCAGSRYGLEEPSYPGIEVESRVLALRIADPRPVVPTDVALVRPRGSRTLAVAVPRQFVPAAVGRLGAVVAGAGPSLEVVAEVERADVVWAPGGRGATVHVAFTFSVYRGNGELLQRGYGQAAAQVSDDALSPEVVKATALDAFDRYWASEKTLIGINRAIRGQG
jgi:hypothetical protein